MSEKVYRTANGKTIDMGALMAQHEDTKAVGNMNVNARGEKLESTFEVRQKQKAGTRIDKRQPKTTNQVRMTHGRWSPVLQQLDKEAREAAPVVPASFEPQQVTVDVSQIDVKEQIEAVADQMLEQIADVVEFEIQEIENEPVTEDVKASGLTGLAAAMAKASANKKKTSK